MYIPQTQGLGIFFLILTMVFWGSWANTLKMSKGTRFEIYYLNFVIGALLMSILFGLTMGTWGDFQLPFFESLIQGHFRHILRAFLAGVLFNVANILLVAAAAFSGIAYAFLTCFGVALIVDTLMRFLILHFNQTLIFVIGMCLVFLAISFITISQRKIPHKLPLAKRTLTLALMAGILIGLFYPLLEKSLDIPGVVRLGPYAANFFFSLGLMICNLLINPIFMRKPIFGHPISLENYFGTRLKVHLLGIVGGALWSMGLSFKLIAERAAGPVFVFIAVQAATIITFLWGIFLWKEIPSGMKLYRYVAFGLACYIAGLILIGISKLG